MSPASDNLSNYTRLSTGNLFIPTSKLKLDAWTRVGDTDASVMCLIMFRWWLQKWFIKSRTKLALRNSLWAPPAKYACSNSLAIYIHHSITCHHNSIVLTLYSWAATKPCRFDGRWVRFPIGFRVYNQHVLPVAHEDDEAHCIYCFPLLYFVFC